MKGQQVGTTWGFTLDQETISELRCQLSEGHPRLRASPSLRVGWNCCLSCLSFPGAWKLSSEWWPVGGKVLIQLISHFPAKTYTLEKYQIYNKEEKQKTQISAGCSENKWFYLHCYKVVSNFCCILRLSLQNVQNKTGTEGDVGEDLPAAQWRG